MSEFSNVSVVKNANVYFDGAVTSRTIKFANGETKTLGIMLPGEYTFNTDKREIIEILQGDVLVMLPDDDIWRHFKAGDSFEVKAKAAFQIKVNMLTDYCCSFVD